MSATSLRGTKSCAVIIMAAGQGTRMRSTQPKVLTELGGRSMLAHILTRVKEATPRSSIAVIVGFGREQIEAAIKSDREFAELKITFVVQPNQRGTGDAVRCAMASEWGDRIVKEKLPVLVLPGDLPLISQDLIDQMIDPLPLNAGLRLLTCELPDPTGYGRVVRKGKAGSVLRIVEERDANVREKAIGEVGASIYTFNSAFLKASLQHLINKNSQHEYYLTDLVAQANRVKKTVDVLPWAHPEEVRGVNDPWELALASRMLNLACIKRWALQGVKFQDPCTAWVAPSVRLAPDVTIGPHVVLSGNTWIEKGAILGPHVVLKSTRVGENAQIRAGTVSEDSEIGAGTSVGPYAHLRPGSKVAKECKIGNFVELKNTIVGDHTSIAHLSYVGDAEVGRNVNIGCGFITCNFDGRVKEGKRKHKTVIEDGVFLGSDCQAIAPIRIGKGAYVASGSTLTQDVDADALAIARTRQVNKAGYAKRLKEGL